MKILTQPDRPLPRQPPRDHASLRGPRGSLPLICAAALSLAALACGCGMSGSQPSTTPSVLTVIVQPTAASLFLGQTQRFQASVTGASSNSVTWEVNGVSGGNSTTGTISTSGLYTAPSALPSPPSVTVTAVSQGDPQASASASVTLQDDLAVTLAPATTLLRMSLEQMSHAAAVIVRAQCLENSTGWDAGEIWTFTSFDVQEVWSGAAPATITVRLLGGRVAGVTSSVSGVPRFRPGEEVVLFLEPTPRGDFSIVSWQQGTFRVRRDAPSSTESVTQDTAAFATFDPAARRFHAAGIRNLPLGAFRARVAAALRAPAPRKP